MSAAPCLVFYGNSVFLAGIKTELERSLSLELITVKAGSPDVASMIRVRRPKVILFDLTAAQPDFAVALLREIPGMLLIGMDPSSDELMVLSSQSMQALNLADLVDIIRQMEHPSEFLEEGKPK